MNLISIQVQCYAGYRADESPRRFFYENTCIEIEEVRDRWYQAHSTSSGQGNRASEWPIADYFKVLGSDGQEHILKHDREYDEWFLASEAE